MLPWGHAAIGYVIYSLYSRWRYRHPPIGLTVVALGLGTQVPDLVDKPLTWTLPILPYGRSLAHSVFALTAVYFALRLWFRYPDQEALTDAFGVGYATHLVADGIGPALSGDYLGLGYVFWPLTEVPTGSSRSFIGFFSSLTLTPLMMFGLVLTAIAVLLWVHDGMPGLKDLIEQQGRDADLQRSSRRP